MGAVEFFLALLLYHLKLRCCVVTELKAGNFKPEHLGQLSFYLTAVEVIAPFNSHAVREVWVLQKGQWGPN